MKIKTEICKKITVRLSPKAQKMLHEYMIHTGQKSEAGAIRKMILRLSDVMSNWHDETIRNKTVSVSPKGKVFYGTPKEIRDNLIDAKCRKSLACDLRLHHNDYIHKWIDRDTFFQLSEQSRRDAIIRQYFTDPKDIIPKQPKKCKYTSSNAEKCIGEFTQIPLE